MNNNKEQGMALILAIVISLFLTVLGLGLTFFSVTEFTDAREFESHQQAFAIADGGFNMTKVSLQGQDLTALLATSSNVPQYISSSASIYRNPIFPLDARNIDFQDPPQPAGVVSVTGLITPLSGTPLGTGRFFARICDNNDGDSDTTVDSDNTVYLRVMGVHPAPLSEMTSHGGNTKNSVYVIETLVKRGAGFNVGAPLTLAGPDISKVRINGNSFSIVGDDSHPGISALYDDPGGNNAGDMVQSVYDCLKKNSRDNIVGAEGDFGPAPAPSIRDDTLAVLNDPDPNVQKILDPNYLADFVDAMGAMADNKYEGNTHFSGGTEFGTLDSPEITFIDGDVHLSGNGSGYGIMVVTGELRYTGAFDYTGLVLVAGEGDAWFSGANKDITGGMILANLEDDGSGGYEYGEPECDWTETAILSMTGPPSIWPGACFPCRRSCGVESPLI